MGCWNKVQVQLVDIYGPPPLHSLKQPANYINSCRDLSYTEMPEGFKNITSTKRQSEWIPAPRPSVWAIYCRLLCFDLSLNPLPSAEVLLQPTTVQQVDQSLYGVHENFCLYLLNRVGCFTL